MSCKTLNIFDQAAYGEILERLHHFSVDSTRKWGKMTPDQTVFHCQMPFKVALDELQLKRMLIGFLFGKIVKNQVVTGEKLKKNSPTAKEFIVTGAYDFEAEKENLINYINRFRAKGPEVFEGKVHPFFGKMTAREWGILQYRHLDHHLEQFSH